MNVEEVRVERQQSFSFILVTMRIFNNQSAVERLLIWDG